MQCIFTAVHTTDWHEPETLNHWREAWCQMVNAEFERKSIAARIDHRSYKAQGIDQIPTVHEGPLVQKMEKRGIHTQKADLNRWITTTNRLIAAVKKGIRTKIDIPAWQQEQDALRENEKALSDEYKSLRGKLNEMRSVQYCVETAQKNESRKMQKRNRELQQ